MGLFAAIAAIEATAGAGKALGAADGAPAHGGDPLTAALEAGAGAKFQVAEVDTGLKTPVPSPVADRGPIELS